MGKLFSDKLTELGNFSLTRSALTLNNQGLVGERATGDEGTKALGEARISENAEDL